ncbi:hypothetical protein [Streptomyces sp. NPDC087298]|uniref:hypothetical protein n=1 Tax=Streptomyces sp. NPDC087298 TaxID=3365779 RepID=UPI0038164896
MVRLDSAPVAAAAGRRSTGAAGTVGCGAWSVTATAWPAFMGAGARKCRARTFAFGTVSLAAAISQ